jgi:F-type H+-transporting ATPase subunit b
MPQLEQLSLAYASQFFWVSLVLLLLYFGVGKYMVSRIEDHMDGRAAKIKADLAAAQAAQVFAAEQQAQLDTQLKAAQEQAHAQINATKAEAAAMTAHQIELANSEIQRHLVSAQVTLQEAHDRALGEIAHHAVEAVQLLSHKLAGLQVESKAAQHALGEALYA